MKRTGAYPEINENKPPRPPVNNVNCGCGCFGCLTMVVSIVLICFIFGCEWARKCVHRCISDVTSAVSAGKEAK